MSDTAVYFLSRVAFVSSSSAFFAFERKSKYRKEKMCKCVKDYHQSSSFVAESDDVLFPVVYFFFSSISIVIVSDAI